MVSKIFVTRSAVVFTIKRNSWLVSTLLCQRYTDSICGTMLTHAAKLRSTKARAIFLASSADPAVLKTTRVLVMNFLKISTIFRRDALFDKTKNHLL